jgi:hypothetical protein
MQSNNGHSRDTLAGLLLLYFRSSASLRQLRSHPNYWLSWEGRNQNNPWLSCRGDPSAGFLRLQNSASNVSHWGVRVGSASRMHISPNTQDLHQWTCSVLPDAPGNAK